ncbi:MAG: hypothetical protein PHR28_14880 [candidate division Zixibacteria bacterium]|nr:hypothetical protein [candidate division Zixibacteria bacterium]
MKRTLYILMIAVVALFLYGSASAIDKTKKDKTVIKVKPTVVDTGQAARQPSSDKKQPDPKLSRSKYDDFIDVNNNGIDDRAEKQGATKPRKEPASDSTSAPPPKK